MTTPPRLADRPVETEIYDTEGDKVGTIFHHGTEVSYSFYRTSFTLDHASASKLAAASIACY